MFTLLFKCPYSNKMFDSPSITCLPPAFHVANDLHPIYRGIICYSELLFCHLLPIFFVSTTFKLHYQIANFLRQVLWLRWPCGQPKLASDLQSMALRGPRPPSPQDQMGSIDPQHSLGMFDFPCPPSTPQKIAFPFP